MSTTTGKPSEEWITDGALLRLREAKAHAAFRASRADDDCAAAELGATKARAARDEAKQTYADLAAELEAKTALYHEQRDPKRPPKVEPSGESKLKLVDPLSETPGGTVFNPAGVRGVEHSGAPSTGGAEAVSASTQEAAEAVARSHAETIATLRAVDSLQAQTDAQRKPGDDTLTPEERKEAERQGDEVVERSKRDGADDPDIGRDVPVKDAPAPGETRRGFVQDRTSSFPVGSLVRLKDAPEGEPWEVFYVTGPNFYDLHALRRGDDLKSQHRASMRTEELEEVPSATAASVSASAAAEITAHASNSAAHASTEGLQFGAQGCREFIGGQVSETAPGVFGRDIIDVTTGPQVTGTQAVDARATYDLMSLRDWDDVPAAGRKGAQLEPGASDCEWNVYKLTSGERVRKLVIPF